MRSILLLGLMALGGCREGLNNGPPDLAVVADPTHCAPSKVSAVPNEGATHVPFGTPIAYKHYPPASGFHWAPAHDWGNFIDQAVPIEWWVHNLEHGGIVFLFNCNGVNGFDYDLGTSPDGGGAMPCPEVTSALVQVAGEKPTGTLVTGYARPGKRIYAVGWDWIYESDTVDLTELRCFRDERWGRGPEKLF